MLNKKKADLAEGGDKLKLKASLKPTGVYNKGVTWKSSKPSVAKVSKSGVVTPLKEGKAVITVTTKEKQKTAKCTVTVKPIMNPVVEIAPGISEFTLNLGRFAQLPASEGATYKSGDEVIAVVNKDGLVTPKAAGEVEITSGSNSWKITVSDEALLNNWVMTGYYKDALINNTKIGANAAAFVWNEDAGKFVAAKKKAKTVLGSYVQLTDQDGDKAADVILAVKYADGAKFWDGETTWINGAGEGREPNVLSDKEWAAMFAEKQRIPMGERLLANWGLGDWSGTTDWAEYVDESGDSPYWANTHIDWSKVNSTDTLTMLTGFKTQLQETGSTCVMNSAISVLDWYGVRGDLNSRDLSSLRDEDRAGGVGGTSLDELENVFEKLGELGLTGEWAMKGYNDIGGFGSLDSEWLQSELKKGHPVIVIWNSWGPHGQVIIGYDNLGTENTADDMLIMMDPYDSTDHNNDGYITQSYERLRDGWLTWTNKNTGKVEMTGTKYLSVWPADEVEGEYAPKNIPAGEAAIIKNNNVSDFSDAGKIPYGNTAADLKEFYPEVEPRYGTPYHGAASKERLADFNNSPYYVMLDAYGTEAEVQKRLGSSTLSILDNFATIQQATQWTCGVTCSLMAIEYFGMNEQRIDENGNKMVDAEGNPIYETDISLCTHRQGGKAGATYRDGMQEIFDYMESEYNQDWITITDMDFDKLAEGYGSHDVLVPYLIKNEIPVMAGWDEWGGHWQAAIGYDDMGTEATQDDVLIMADPYDTTDHNQNGYLLESYERLVYGWYSCFEDWNYETDKYINEPGADNYGSLFVAIPNTPEYADVIKTLGLN